MRNHRMIVGLAVLFALALVGNVAAQCGCGGGGSSAAALSTPPGATPLVLVTRTFGLYAGELNVSLTETLGGVKLMAKVAGRSGQPDRQASVSVYGTGHFGSRGIKLAPVSAGVWATMANLANLDELAVRVNRPGMSQLVYVGIPGKHIGRRCGGQCGGGQAGCKADGQGGCSMMAEGKCAKMGDCKAAAAKCPMQGKCKLHQGGQPVQQGGCGGKGGCAGGFGKQ